MSTYRQVYEKLLNGDSISDEELEESLYFFRKLEDNLTCLGPVFSLAAKEAGRVYRELYGFMSARKDPRKITEEKSCESR